MVELKPGKRLRSAVCATEVMVVAAPRAAVALSCGGAPMIGIEEKAAAGGTVAPDAASGTLLGKRYVNEAGDLELLCTRPGAGSLQAGGVALALKEAKPLPSSD